MHNRDPDAGGSEHIFVDKLNLHQRLKVASAFPRPRWGKVKFPQSVSERLDPFSELRLLHQALEQIFVIIGHVRKRLLPWLGSQNQHLNGASTASSLY